MARSTALLLALLGCHTPSPSPPPSESPASVPGLDVHIETEPGLRDLQLIAEGPTRIQWFEDGTSTEIHGDRVPAHRLWPGAVWRVEIEDELGLTGAAEYTVPEPAGGNVLVLLLDDVGVDKVSSYGRPQSPATPVLDGLAADGVRFTRAYTSMACSPTRAALLTGRFGSRTGLGWLVDGAIRDYKLPLEALTIPEMLDQARVDVPWSHSALGKWHIAGPQADGYLTHPNDQGFDWYAGRMLNPWYADGTGYYVWEKNVNGVLETSHTYMTTDLADDAIERMASMPEPWFLYVAFNAVHTPLQVPPIELVSTVPDEDAPSWELYDAMLEALETEIARLLDSMTPEVRARTTIIVAGDNGTHNHANPPEFNDFRNKGTPYEGGIRVPLIVVSPHVTTPGSTSDALVHLVDVLPTVADIAGVPLTGPHGEQVESGTDTRRELDGRSLLPFLVDPNRDGRQYVYAEGFRPNGDPDAYTIDRKALQDHDWKLVRRDGVEEFYRIDPLTELDTVDLLALPSLDADQQQAYDRLVEEMDRVADTVIYEGF